MMQIMLSPPLTIVSRGFDSQNRTLTRFTCKVCKSYFYARADFEPKCCSRQCTGVLKRVQVKLVCAQCDCEFERQLAHTKKSKSRIYFCSRKCKDIGQGLDYLSLNPRYKNGKFVYRLKALKHYGTKCTNCGFDEHPLLLDVDHRDSNRSNNKIENLNVLCVMCHARKTRLKEPIGVV